MKIFVRSKHIIVTLLLFFGLFAFIFPIVVNAAAEDVFYGGIMRPDENLSMRSWGKSLILGNAVDIALAFPCGGEIDKNLKINYK